MESRAVQAELSRFDSPRGETDERRPIVPVVLGDAELLHGAPQALTSRQAAIVGQEAYAAGPEEGSDEWMRAVSAVVDVVNNSRLTASRDPMQQSSSGASASSAESTQEPPQEGSPAEEAELPSFSHSALRALSYAAAMLSGSELAQIRTAALLGALRESEAGGRTPTTGDVIQFVLERQTGRDVQQTLAEAAAAADLRPVRGLGSEMPIEKLSVTPGVRSFVEEAIEISRQTEADSVHLHHVLATGVHPDVSPEALAELRISLSELRAEVEGLDRADLAARVERCVGPALRRTPSRTSRPRRHAAERARARDRWTTEDRLDYALYAKAIAEFIGHKDAKPPMVISVQAPWGQGKTSLMRMVQHDLDPGHPDLVKDIGTATANNAISATTSTGSHADPPSRLTYGELQTWLTWDRPPGRRQRRGISALSGSMPGGTRAASRSGPASRTRSSPSYPRDCRARDRELFWLRLQLRRIDPSAVRADIHRCGAGAIPATDSRP